MARTRESRIHFPLIVSVLAIIRCIAGQDVAPVYRNVTIPIGGKDHRFHNLMTYCGEMYDECNAFCEDTFASLNTDIDLQPPCEQDCFVDFCYVQKSAEMVEFPQGSGQYSSIATLITRSREEIVARTAQHVDGGKYVDMDYWTCIGACRTFGNIAKWLGRQLFQIQINQAIAAYTCPVLCYTDFYKGPNKPPPPPQYL